MLWKTILICVGLIVLGELQRSVGNNASRENVDAARAADRRIAAGDVTRNLGWLGLLLAVPVCGACHNSKEWCNGK
jgi:hypothetical protein